VLRRSVEPAVTRVVLRKRRPPANFRSEGATPKVCDEEQSERFTETTRKLGVDETRQEAALQGLLLPNLNGNAETTSFI
jgi:hypothetical protein